MNITAEFTKLLERLEALRLRVDALENPPTPGKESLIGKLMREHGIKPTPESLRASLTRNASDEYARTIADELESGADLRIPESLLARYADPESIDLGGVGYAPSETLEDRMRAVEATVKDYEAGEVGKAAAWSLELDARVETLESQMRRMVSQYDADGGDLARRLAKVEAHFAETDGVSVAMCAGAGLLPCPFCGSLNLRMESTPDPFWINCLNCVAEGPAHSTTDKAIKAWNTRIPTGTPARPDERVVPSDGELRAFMANQFGCEPNMVHPREVERTREALTRFSAPAVEWSDGEIDAIRDRHFGGYIVSQTLPSSWHGFARAIIAGRKA